MRRAIMGVFLWLAASAGAQEAEQGYLQPSISVFGLSEHADGPAYASPNEAPPGLAAAAAAGLDARRRFRNGGMQATAFALVQDPFSDDDRGLFAAGRWRASLRTKSGWRLLLDDSARLQRRGTGPLSDFQRNDLVLGLEHVAASGSSIGLRVGDRRRAVQDAPHLDFDRQSIAGSFTWGRPGTQQWRVEAGPQFYSTDADDGSRLAVTAEWSGRAARWNAAVRVTWLEPFDGLGLSSPSSALATDTAPPAAPAPAPTATPPPLAPAPTPPPPVPTPMPPTPTSAERTFTAAPPREGLLGPSLIVDPLEDDEGDWDFGRRKQEIVAFVSRSFGPRYSLTAELRADIERGPDLLAPAAPDVRRERLAARLHLRRTLGSRWVALGQAGWQNVSDNRPGLAYSRGVFSIGLEFRP